MPSNVISVTEEEKAAIDRVFVILYFSYLISALISILLLKLTWHVIRMKN